SLTWTVSAGAASYSLYRGTTPGGEGATPFKTGVTATSFTDSQVTAGTQYYYQVTAVNAAGAESARSNEVPATAQPPVPPASITLSPLADSYVRDADGATSNFGTATQLQVKNASVGFNREIYVKFDLTGLGAVSSARLRLFGADEPAGTARNQPVAVY